MRNRTTQQAPQPEAYAQRLVLAVLLDAAQRGEHLTSRQIGERTATTPTAITDRRGTRFEAFPISDPRRTIAHLRARGYEIADEWDTNEHGKGFKRYWLADPSQVIALQQGKEARNG